MKPGLHENVNHVFVASVPRSGSTVLTRMLESYEDILALPETFFPPILDMMSDDDFRNINLVAALFLESCSDGSPLTFEEACACVRNSRKETLAAIASAVAVKSGRFPESIRVVVWKFTRMVGCWKWAHSIGGRFIVLRRPFLNVYESQFRVPFGDKNRNPLRCALFYSSYETAFQSYPDEHTYRISYADIPAKIHEIARWCGSISKSEPTTRASGVSEIAAGSSWHAEINKPFVNTDELKIKNLSLSRRYAANFALGVLTHLPYLSKAARSAADHRQMQALLVRARLAMHNRYTTV